MNQQTDRKYAVGLSFFEGIGPIRFRLLRNYFGSAEKAYKAKKEDLLETGLGNALVKNFCIFREKFDLDKFISDFEKKNVFFIVEGDKDYPSSLKETKAAPFILFGIGDRNLLYDKLKLAVVGTRKATRYGVEVTEKLTAGLVQEGFTIVSGMAMGIDAVAHKTTLDLSGRTIAVLGCGVDVCYPAINRSIYERICKTGLVLSEFPPGKRTSKGVFASRNRIVAGLSLGVLVTEGAEKSGALITASYAADFGIDVFVVPGPITSEMSKATTFLLKQGVKPVSSAEDILEEYKIQYDNSRKEKKLADLSSLKNEERIIVELIKKEGQIHIDEIVRILDISSSQVFSYISILEVKGIIKEIDSGEYTISVV